MTDVVQCSAARVRTPLGDMVLVADRRGRLRAADWTDREDRMYRLLRLQYGEHGFHIGSGGSLDRAIAAIRRYFGGDLRAIEVLQVETAGTPFQQVVWQTLRAIPAGTAVSYRWVARRIGRPAAVRAVGHANGANAIGIVVPCHRVIGSDGSLAGYGGGIERKRWLLEHEGWRPHTD